MTSSKIRCTVLFSIAAMMIFSTLPAMAHPTSPTDSGDLDYHIEYVRECYEMTENTGDETSREILVKMIFNENCTDLKYHITYVMVCYKLGNLAGEDSTEERFAKKVFDRYCQHTEPIPLILL